MNQKPNIDNMQKILMRATSRESFLSTLTNEQNIQTIAEIEVGKGHLPTYLLKACKIISKHYLNDSWNKLPNWNKAYNIADQEFSTVYKEAMTNVNFLKHKPEMLGGITSENFNKIPDKILDLAYIDGDQTLRGITIDLLSIYSKDSDDSVICRDDFVTNILQHRRDYGPKLVFPFAVYFAEFVNKSIYALSYVQLLILKNSTSFSFIGLTGKYRQSYLLGLA